MPAFRAKKKLGQNFLISKEIVSKIIDQISPNSDETIIEIGPGRGALTFPLAKSGARIIAIEFDNELYRKLEMELHQYKNVALLQQDFLKFDPAQLALKTFKLAGNLPFNISSPVIDWIVNHHHMIIKAVIMIQKEVALRLTSSSGSKQWSPLAIFTQLYFEAAYCFNVAPSNFKPSPKVTSAVVELTPKIQTNVRHYEAFEKLVRTSFKQRRKQLINNLVPDIISSMPTAREIIAELGLNKNVRAEEIATAQFLELTEWLVGHNMLK